MNNYVKNINEYDIQYCIYEHYLKILSIYHNIKSNFPLSSHVVTFDVEEAAIAINIKFLTSKVFERKF